MSKGKTPSGTTENSLPSADTSGSHTSTGQLGLLPSIHGKGRGLGDRPVQGNAEDGPLVLHVTGAVPGQSPLFSIQFGALNRGYETAETLQGMGTLGAAGSS